MSHAATASALVLSDGLQRGDSDDPATKKRHLEIIERLLENFNMEETVNRYRTAGARDIAIDKKNYSMDCEFEASVMHDRVTRLTGSHVVRVNDRNYSLKLNRRLKEEYEDSKDKQESIIADGEKQRLHRLVLQGVIRPAEDSGHQPKTRRASKTYSRKGSMEATTSSLPPQQPRVRSAPPRHSHDARDCEDTLVSRLASSKPTGGDRTSKTEINNNTCEEKEIQISSGKKNTLKKHEPPLVARLKKEETVAGLYRIANIILPP